MQIVLVFVVIFVPQSVTMFLDKEIVVDLDKVQIEMPTEEPVPALELKPGELPASTDPKDMAAEADKAAETAVAEEQKKIDDLFKK
jgi:hypothetical protein